MAGDIRLTTWNVNGIRNPFGYQPWRDKKTFERMFDILEADIIVFQETKIQRKDLRDDMVLVPGFDCYWSLPKHKKGYSGVVVYTRNEKCAPIRAEEGITGMLTPPNSTTSFRQLPEDDQIGGYPTREQLSQSAIDVSLLDAEGRCVILEFPAFVLIGTYCPAERDETRTHFRTAFLDLLDARIRNLVKMGKRVIWTGDLNISREAIDTAAAGEMMRKKEVDPAEWMSTPARRLFNQMLVGGIVHGARDEGRETAIMWDVCRSFHEGRKGMYTCWETKVNARPGNFGARIDYVVCSHGMKDWFRDSNIQEGLMGSDHCPVYAVIKERIDVDGVDTHVYDIMNPPGMFENGVRKQPWTPKCLLSMSGKLIPEFDRRRNIKDMFGSMKGNIKDGNVKDGNIKDGNIKDGNIKDGNIKDGNIKDGNIKDGNIKDGNIKDGNVKDGNVKDMSASRNITKPLPTEMQPMRMKSSPVPALGSKRPFPTEMQPMKRMKSGNDAVNSKGQQSLKGFFKSTVGGQSLTGFKSTVIENEGSTGEQNDSAVSVTDSMPDSTNSQTDMEPASADSQTDMEPTASTDTQPDMEQSWEKLFARPRPPKCEHDEPCKTMLTKKPGVNCGRSFWMCNRPLGPSGDKEKGTPWRCSTFIWCSDWDRSRFG